MKTKCGLFRAEVQTGERQKSRSGGRQRSKYGEAVHRQKHKDVGRSVVKKQAEFRAQAGKGQGKKANQGKAHVATVSKNTKTQADSRGKRFKQFTKTEKTHVAKSVQKAVYKHRQVTMQGAHPEQ